MRKIIVLVAVVMAWWCVGCNNSSAPTAVDTSASFPSAVIWVEADRICFKIPVSPEQQLRLVGWPNARPVWHLNLFSSVGIIVNSPAEDGLVEEGGYLTFSVPSSLVPTGEIFLQLHLNDTWRMIEDGSSNNWRAKNSTGGFVYLITFHGSYWIDERTYGFYFRDNVVFLPASQ